MNRYLPGQGEHLTKPPRQTPEEARQQARQAQIATARHSTGPQDLRLLLDILGLLHDTRQEDRS